MNCDLIHLSSPTISQPSLLMPPPPPSFISTLLQVCYSPLWILSSSNDCGERNAPLRRHDDNHNNSWLLVAIYYSINYLFISVFLLKSKERVLRHPSGPFTCPPPPSLPFQRVSWSKDGKCSSAPFVVEMRLDYVTHHPVNLLLPHVVIWLTRPSRPPFFWSVIRLFHYPGILISRCLLPVCLFLGPLLLPARSYSLGLLCIVLFFCYSRPRWVFSTHLGPFYFHTLDVMKIIS